MRCGWWWILMVVDHLDEYDGPYLACKAIGPKVGMGGGVAAPFGCSKP